MSEKEGEPGLQHIDSVFHAPGSLGMKEAASSAHSPALKESVTLPMGNFFSPPLPPPGDTGSFTSESPLPLHKNEMINPNQQSINPEMSMWTLQRQESGVRGRREKTKHLDARKGAVA